MEVQSQAKSHWTHKLFIEHPDLYLPFLEQAKERAPQEVDVLAGLLADNGVSGQGRVLDLACGIGRHSALLAKQGYQVTGVDISPLYVQKAHEYASSEGVDVRFLVGDMLETDSLLSDEAPFDAMISMFTSHSYYGREGDLRTFRQLRQLASPKAVLVVLTANRDFIIRQFAPEGLEKAGNMRVLQQRSLDLENSVILNRWSFIEGHDANINLRMTLDMDHRIYSLHDFKALLEEAGWHYICGLGREQGENFSLGTLTIESNAMWVVARA